MSHRCTEDSINKSCLGCKYCRPDGRLKSKKPRTPHCNRLAKRQDERMAISDFLDWLNGRGMFIAGHRGPNDPLIYQYLGVSPVALDRERRALLEWTQAKS